MKEQDSTTAEQNTNQETFAEQNPPSPKKDKEWIAWRKAKRDGRLQEHRKMRPVRSAFRVLRSSPYRKMMKSEENQQDRERSR